MVFVGYHSLTFFVSIAAIDVEANGNNHSNATVGGTINNGVNGKKADPPKADAIQQAMGSLGRWHIIVCAFIFLLKFPVAWHQMRFVHAMLSKNKNYSLRMTITHIKQNRQSNLFLYYSNIFTAANVNYTCADANIDINQTCSAKCTEYTFDRSIFSETIQMTWNLVCSKKHLPNTSQTIFMFGILVGNMVFGTIADK